MNEKGHSQEKEEIGHRQIEDEDIWNGVFGVALGLPRDGVDNGGVGRQPEKADDSEDDGKDGAALRSLICSCGESKRNFQKSLVFSCFHPYLPVQKPIIGLYVGNKVGIILTQV